MATEVRRKADWMRCARYKNSKYCFAYGYGRCTVLRLRQYHRHARIETRQLLGITAENLAFSETVAVWPGPNNKVPERR
jgi:hypothetical protein